MRCAGTLSPYATLCHPSSMTSQYHKEADDAQRRIRELSDRCAAQAKELEEVRSAQERERKRKLKRDKVAREATCTHM